MQMEVVLNTMLCKYCIINNINVILPGAIEQIDIN